MSPFTTPSRSLRTNSLPILAAFFALASALGAPSSAIAQSADPAEELFNRGMTEMEAGHYRVACKAFAESQKLDPNPGTLFTLAVCETRWGRIATAFARYGEYLTLYEELSPDKKKSQRERPAEAKKQREVLGPEIPMLTLTLPPGAPRETVVTLDGDVLTNAALAAALPVDPGEHTVTTRAPGGAVSEQLITINKREKKTLTLEVKIADTPKPEVKLETKPHEEPPEGAETKQPQPDSAKGPSGRRVAAYVAGGAGLAGLVLGGVMGGLTLSKKGTITDHCGAAVQSSDEAACDSTGLDAAGSAKTTALVSSIGFGVGAVGVGAAIVLLLTEPASSKPATGANRRWMTAGLLSAGPDGAALGVRGSW